MLSKLNIPKPDPRRAGKCVATNDCEDDVIISGLCQRHLDIADAPDPKHHCDYCEVSYSLEEPPPLTSLCEHGARYKRVFADYMHMSMLPDGRTLVQLDMPPAMLEGVQICFLVDARDAERMRIKLGRRGAAGAERWHAP